MTQFSYFVTMVIALLTAIELGWTSPSQAQIYQFISPDGVIHFTNVPTDPRYRRMGKSQSLPMSRSSMEIQQSIHSAARQKNLDPALIKAVIKVESDFDPQAVSKAGAMGLMQLMPATAATLQVHDPFNPHENIAAGTRHLSDLLNRFDGNLTLALAAYHAGEKRVRSHGSIPPIKQTHRYIKKVMAAYRLYQQDR
jgi:soluble lytic murein transglycosylase-like protein